MRVRPKTAGVIYDYPITSTPTRFARELPDLKKSYALFLCRPEALTLTMDNAPAICEDCGKEIRGRSDKRFCDDICRNNFNRKKRQAEKVSISDDALEVIRLIKRNYQLLKSKDLAPGVITYQPVRDLLNKGFNPDYFTSTREVDGELYCFCFECGFRISEGYIFVIERNEQIQLHKSK
ncbi:MAG TPA: hypothetical protein VK668_03755 [Mucilaginibacter sp.]|nr:hypothetical protein [Mucilaginibacter sp.]